MEVKTMASQTFKLIELDEGGVRGKDNLRLVCLIEGGGKLAIWGSIRDQRNINIVQSAGMPCDIECDCIPSKQEWKDNYRHTYWVPEKNSLRVLHRRKIK